MVTLLYEGGVILTSRKTSYEDQLETEDLETVVRELMEHQHRDLVRALKDGELDVVVGIAEQTAPEFISTQASAPVLEAFRAAQRHLRRVARTERSTVR